MTTQHTPGPWEAEDNSWETSTIYADGKEVARCYIDGEADEYNQDRFERVKEANARLIAAAPDLLEALKEAATSLQTISRLAGKPSYIGDDGERIPTFMEHHDEVRGYSASRASVARAAIAKATGTA